VAALTRPPPQQSELLLSTFTSDYLSLMKTSSKAGPTLSEKHVEGVVNAYQSRLDGAHAVGSLLHDSAEDSLEATVDSSATFLLGGSGSDSAESYSRLFGMDSPSPPAGTQAPLGTSPAVVSHNFPAVPTKPPSGHRRTTSLSAPGDGGGIGWMLDGENS